jgi:predicted RNase H-like HicB family nuclease
MRELFVEAREDRVDGGYVASAIGHGIHTQAETLDELRTNILDAVECYFDDPADTPTVIHLRVVSEEELVR